MADYAQGDLTHREQLTGPVVVIRQEFMAITGGCPAAAALIGFFEYQATTVAAARDGWYYQSIAGLVEKLLYTFSERAIRRALGYLVEAGMIERRANPVSRWDRTWQYRVDVDAVQMMLDAYLDGIDVQESRAAERGDREVQSAGSSDANRSHREAQNDSLESVKTQDRKTHSAAIEKSEAGTSYTRIHIQESQHPDSNTRTHESALRAEVVAPLAGSHPLWKLLEDQHDMIDADNRQYQQARGFEQRESWEDPAALRKMEAQFGRAAVVDAVTITRSKGDVRDPIAYARGVARRRGAPNAGVPR